MFKNTLSAGLIVIASFCYFSFAADIAKPEPLYGLSFSENGINIMVKSNGCTKSTDFRVDVQSANQVSVLNIYRIKKDRCRKMTRVIAVNLELIAPYSGPYQLSNPLYNQFNLK